MPKAGDVTFAIEPLAVLEAVGWLLSYEPNTSHASALLTAPLTASQLAEREQAWRQRVGKATLPLLHWLRRRRRLERYNEAMPICLDRQLVKWLAEFAPSRHGGIFGSANTKKLKAPKPQSVQHFFSACRAAVSKRVGRPKITPSKAAARLRTSSSDMPSTTLWRMEKVASERLPEIRGLLAAYQAKNSLIVGTKTP